MRGRERRRERTDREKGGEGEREGKREEGRGKLIIKSLGSYQKKTKMLTTHNR